jgi:hypothetical protein
VLYREYAVNVHGIQEGERVEQSDGRISVTIHDVAALAGVSHATVSRVLNDSSSVRDRTRTRVKDAIQSLNYHPDPDAQALGRRRSAPNQA